MAAAVNAAAQAFVLEGVEALEGLLLVDITGGAEAVLAGQQEFRVHTVLDHVRGAPFAGDQSVVAQMPVEVVGEILRPATFLPGPRDVEGLVVQDKDSAGALTVGGAQGIDVDSVRPAVCGVG